MEVYNLDTSDGANVAQRTYEGIDSQIWTITEKENGYYSFINKHSGNLPGMH
ncbi:RICIN domain-containing protein [Microbulbifer rhizosphaerae]|uniref:Ricin B lectin domain-containing protein n=1 Tax=Microbulbifer rhizosphaerae TaxID=1562603 RepID=A0A7W4WDV0_9GAMM|nr:RICIN domain-containing protein [Microbulbifer rhizosphaerae]MBB3062418.1 hypothetical protein [Microbulbifer rhizosphaerae]